jgi:hypothetical protein
MPNFRDIMQAYSEATGRFNAAANNLRGFLIGFRNSIEQELNAPHMSVVLFPINGEPTKDYSESASMAWFDDINSWHFGLAITLGNSQRAKYRIIVDMRNGEYFARIGPDGQPYEVRKDINGLASKLAELAIERLSKLSMDPNASQSFWIEMRGEQEPSVP